MSAQDKSIAHKGAGIKRTTIRVERLIIRKDDGKETSLVKATFKSFTGKAPVVAYLKGLKFIKEQLDNFEPLREKLMEGDEIIMFVRWSGRNSESIDNMSFNKSRHSMDWLTYQIQDFDKLLLLSSKMNLNS
jgi:hypothetical protein